MDKKDKWLNIVIQALEMLGGHAKLKDIYAKCKELYPKQLSRTYDATIRRTLEDKNETTNKPKPIFYCVDGLGKGHWGLIKYRDKQNVINGRFEDVLGYSQNNFIDAMLSDGTKEMSLPKMVTTKEQQRFFRSSKIKVEALKKAHYKCEFNQNHSTFNRRPKDRIPYTEAHHLIPMSAQKLDKFKNINLDCKENIVSLCSECHNKLHYGIGFELILKKLFNDRVNLLKSKGIEITFEELLEFYK